MPEMHDKTADGTDSPAEAFRRLYDDPNAGWGGNSGPGSSPYHAMEYRAFLEKFIRMNSIKSLVDIGCGDWQFSRFIDFDGIEYRGFDVVDTVIERNQKKFGSKTILFSIMPDNLSAVPAADLLIMKDVLQHLPDEEIRRFREQIFGRYKFVLLTNSYEKLSTPRNVDILHGEFRCLDLSAPPYSFFGAYVLEFTSPAWERIRTFLYCGA